MSKTIDSKVVEMRFDNKQFEQGVASTLNSVQKLEKGLDMKGASRGIEEFSYKAGFHLSDVQAKMSSLLEYDFARKLIQQFKSITSALTIQPVTTGFNEYELKMGSIQTIMASTGESLESVNGYLNELNEYSDKTIYSFSDMTQNIGKFTNSGVSLEDSVAAIQGVSNVAAVSGANANEASRAMYNFAQALSSGYVKLIDWKSIELANMGTVEFKNQLLEAAAAAGTLTKTGDGMYKTVDGKLVSATKNFNDSLQDQWMTSEVLINTLKNYSDESTEIGRKATQAATEVKTLSQLYDTLKESAQSGWAQTWEIIVGDFEEAKEFLSELNDLIGGWIGSQAEARNDMLENWKVLGGRTALLEALKNLLEGIGSIVKPIGQAFREIFPPMTAERLLGFTEGLKNLADRLKVGKDTADKIKRTFKGVFALLDIGRIVLVEVFNAISDLLTPTGNLSNGILDITAGVGDFLVVIRDFIKESGVLGGVLSFTGDIISGVFNLLGKLCSFIGEAFSNGPVASLADFFNNLGDSIAGSKFFEILNILWDTIKVVGSMIMNVLGNILGAVTDNVNDGGLMTVSDIIKTLVTGGLGVALISLINNMKTAFSGIKSVFKSLKDIGEGFADALDALTGCLQGFQNNLNAKALKTLATAIAILVASLLVLSLINKEKLMDAIAAMSLLFVELMVGLAIFNKNKTGLFSGVSALNSIATAILILSISLKVLSDLETNEMMRGLLGVAALMGLVIATAKLLGGGNKTIIKGAAQMILFAAAIKILASVCIDIASLGWEELAKGLTGVGVLLAEVSLFMKTAKFSGKAMTTAIGMIAMAAAIKILASACGDFASMQWGGIAKGLTAIGALLLEIALFTRLTGNAKKVISTGVALIAIAAAMKIFASAMQDFSDLGWGGIAKGLVAMAGALAAVVVALRLMPKNMIAKSISLIAIATALLIMSNAVSKMGKASWSEVAKSLVTLGGALLVISIGLHAMKGTAGGSVAMIMMAAALAILTPSLVILGTLSWRSIAAGLVALAGAFLVIGISGKLLKPVVITLMKLSFSLISIGASVLILGAGMVAVGMGLSAIAVGIGALISVITGGGLAALATEIGNAFIAIIQVLADSMPVIGKFIKNVVLMIVDVLVECIPVLADGLIKIIVGVLRSLADYIPEIVDLLFEFIISIIDGLANNMPKLIKSIVNLLTSIFQGVIDALESVDVEVLIKGIGAIGALTGVLLALSLLAPMVPSAMVGVLGLGVLVPELAFVLSALGALTKIPGLDDFINRGGEILSVVGKAIGSFIGSIADGILGQITSSLPKIASDLSSFMTNIRPFIEGARDIDMSMVDGVLALSAMILALTAANVIEGIASWITGESSIESFAEELPKIGQGLKAFSDSTAGIVPENIVAAAEAAKALADMAATIPNSGGVASWFAGENSISQFANELPALGKGLKGFSDSVAGIVPENVTAAANAAKTLADMTSMIPNSGGVASWFAGENSISKFSEEIICLGAGLKGFSDITMGIVPENIVAASNAAKVLAEMTSTIPNSGGVAAWFAGDNSVAMFATDIVSLGHGLKGFSDATVGIVPENIIAASNAAKAIAEMANTIPNSGGVVAWFAGDNSIASFASELPKLGQGLKSFSDKVVGIVPENIVAASNAAKALVEMSNSIPNEGGVVSWFSGESSITSFASQLPILGAGLKGFSDSVTGIVPENVIAASNAAKALADMTSAIPNEGGIVAWFVGESSISKFGNELPALGRGLKGFSDSVGGIVPENITAASNAAKALAEMISVIPKEGGIAAWFTGEQSVSKFAGDLPALGNGLKDFSTAVEGINPENVTAASNAAKALAEMTSVIPKEGGIAAWFTGETSIATFADKLPTLGEGLKGFSDSVEGIVPENVTAAANAAKALGEMTSTVPDDTSKIIDFGTNLVTFGGKLSEFFTSVEGITAESASAITPAIDAVKQAGDLNTTAIKSASDAIAKLVSAIKSASGVTADSTSGFVSAVKKLGEVSVNAFVKSFETIAEDMKKIAKTAIDAFVKGIGDNKKSAKTAGTELAEACADAISESSGAFSDAGADVVSGFASGISENSYLAEAKARAMARAAAEAAEEELDINSPSKVLREIGTSVPEGFAQGVGKFGEVVSASKDMANGAVSGVKDSLRRIADYVNEGVDTEPVIRPVLDLSSVESGVRKLGNMVNIGSSVGLLTNVGAINTGMARNNQNGKDAVGNNTNNVTYNTYNVDGVTYDDGSNIAHAVEELVHAAKVERRT